MHNIIRAKTSGSNLAEVTRSTNINNDTMCGEVMASKLQVMASKLQVTAPKLQVTRTKLQVTSSKLTSLTAETNKFQLTNMLFITF